MASARVRARRRLRQARGAARRSAASGAACRARQQAAGIALDQAGEIGRGAEDAGEQIARRRLGEQRCRAAPSSARSLQRSVSSASTRSARSRSWTTGAATMRVWSAIRPFRARRARMSARPLAVPVHAVASIRPCPIVAIADLRYVCRRRVRWRRAPRVGSASTHAQAGRVVLQAHGAAVQARDGGDEAQAQAAAGPRAALLQAHEALQRALAVLRRDAGAAIGDGDLDGVARRAAARWRFGRAAPSAALPRASSRNT